MGMGEEVRVGLLAGEEEVVLEVDGADLRIVAAGLLMVGSALLLTTGSVRLPGILP